MQFEPTLSQIEKKLSLAANIRRMEINSEEKKGWGMGNGQEVKVS